MKTLAQLQEELKRLHFERNAAIIRSEQLHHEYTIACNEITAINENIASKETEIWKATAAPTAKR